MVPFFGYPKILGAVVYPKRDPNFDNHPYVSYGNSEVPPEGFRGANFELGVSGLGFRGLGFRVKFRVWSPLGSGS